MKKLILMLALLFILPVGAHAASISAQRDGIQKMQGHVLNQLYRAQPGAEKDIANAAGYAVFSSADVAALFVSGSYGHGIAHNNKTGKETYMQMASAGVGVGLGVKDFRAVFVFTNPDSFHDFVNTGLDLSGHIDVAAKEGVKGGAFTGATDALPGVRVYQLTKNGLEAQAMLKGTKYWRDDDLNNASLTSNSYENR